MKDKLDAIEIFFDEEVSRSKDEKLGKRTTLVVISRVLRRIKYELCDSNPECFLYIMDLWIAIDENDEYDDSLKH